MNYIARVNPRYFAAIACFAANRDVRHYLNGVCIAPHHERGAVLVATNGHLIGAIHDPDGHVDTEIIVPTPSAAVLRACLYAGTKAKSQKLGRRTAQVEAGKPGARLLWIGHDRIIVNSSDRLDPPPAAFSDSVIAMATNKLVDGRFPDWRRVLPKAGEAGDGITPAFGPLVLEPFIKAAKILGSEDSGWPIIFEHRGSTNSAVVRFGAAELGERFIGVAMPMRSDALPDGFPSFVTERPAPKLVPKAKPRARVVDGVLVPAASA